MHERKTMQNYYYKVHSGPVMLSGICLCQPGQIVSNVDFVNCDFHPSCLDAGFEDCTFTNCEGMQYLQFGPLSNCVVK